MAPPHILVDFSRPTKAFHHSSYPSISPTRPELNLKGQTVFITGGARGIGLETSHAFATAGVARIILLARSEGPLLEAKEAIEAAHPNTQVLIYATSVTDTARVNEIVATSGPIDILVLNAATMPAPGPILDLDSTALLETFTTNVLAPLDLVKAFAALPPRHEGAKRTVLAVSTAGTQFVIPGVAGYNATKAAFTYVMRAIAEESVAKGLRVFTYHPAIAFTAMAKDVMGLKEDSMTYDSLDLPASFAVWLASPEADFLQNRFLWSNWDVDELKAKKDLIEQDPFQLKIGLVMDKLVAQ